MAQMHGDGTSMTGYTGEAQCDAALTGNRRDDAYRQIEMCAPYATNVHFKTHVTVERQEQVADWSRILGILGKAGYRGYLALEYESLDNPVVEVPKLIAKMRAVIRVSNEA